MASRGFYLLFFYFPFQAVSSVPGLARRECALQLCLKLLEFGLITEFGIELCCPNKKVGGILMMLSIVKNPYHWDFYVIGCEKSLSLGFLCYQLWEKLIIGISMLSVAACGKSLIIGVFRLSIVKEKLINYCIILLLSVRLCWTPHAFLTGR
jgi:hypothetical protein